MHNTPFRVNRNCACVGHMQTRGKHFSTTLAFYANGPSLSSPQRGCTRWMHHNTPFANNTSSNEKYTKFTPTHESKMIQRLHSNIQAGKKEFSVKSFSKLCISQLISCYFWKIGRRFRRCAQTLNRPWQLTFEICSWPARYSKNLGPARRDSLILSREETTALRFPAIMLSGSDVSEPSRFNYRKFW